MNLVQNQHLEFLVIILINLFKGCWRKITVDDFVPCDENGSVLLPTTKKENELWPLLLCKALIKVASLE